MKAFRILLFCILYSFLVHPLNAQNLVPNPSFEETDPFCGIMFPYEFNSVMIDWITPTAGASSVYYTDITDSCYNHMPLSTYGGPIGFKGTQMPRTDSTMAGIWVYTIEDFNQRHYLQVELTSPMIVGETYDLEFFVSLGDFMESFTDKIGAHFSTEAIGSGNDGVLDYSPQIGALEAISDSEGWVSINGILTADQAYTHLTIGNFFDDAATVTQANSSSSGEPGTYGAYYFIDDVSVVLNSTDNVADLNEISINIYPTLVEDFLNIETDKTVELFDIKVFNTMGKLVLAKVILNTSTQLNLSGLESGIYIVSVKAGEFEVVQRVIRL